MGITKSASYTEKHVELAALLKALGHPARVAIVEHLLKVNACICGDLVDVLPLSQPTVSQHLKELKNVGIIQGEIQGNQSCYCLNPKTLERLAASLADISKTIIEKTNCC